MPNTIFPAQLCATDALVTPPALSATMSQSYNGALQRGIFKLTATFADFSAAALTADLTICTLPAKTRIVAMHTDTTTAFTGSAGTVALIVGTGAGAAEYIATHDVKSAAIRKGLADADMGSLLTRAAAIQGGSMPSWTATQAVVARITSGTGNTSTITAGSVTFYVVVEQYV